MLYFRHPALDTSGNPSLCIQFDMSVTLNLILLYFTLLHLTLLYFTLLHFTLLYFRGALHESEQHGKIVTVRQRKHVYVYAYYTLP